MEPRISRPEKGLMVMVMGPLQLHPTFNGSVNERYGHDMDKTIMYLLQNIEGENLAGEHSTVLVGKKDLRLNRLCSHSYSFKAI
jgi:hypothetical protein